MHARTEKQIAAKINFTRRVRASVAAGMHYKGRSAKDIRETLAKIDVPPMTGIESPCCAMGMQLDFALDEILHPGLLLAGPCRRLTRKQAVRIYGKARVSRRYSASC